jgi:hypothetical protein
MKKVVIYMRMGRKENNEKLLVLQKYGIICKK